MLTLLLLQGWAFFTLVYSLQSYVVDGYGAFASSGLAGADLLRSSAGGCFPLCVLSPCVPSLPFFPPRQSPFVLTSTHLLLFSQLRRRNVPLPRQRQSVHRSRRFRSSRHTVAVRLPRIRTSATATFAVREAAYGGAGEGKGKGRGGVKR